MTAQEKLSNDIEIEIAEIKKLRHACWGSDQQADKAQYSIAISKLYLALVQLWK